MKLEEGMYVRTKKGMMAKIISKEDVSGSLHKEEIVFILDNGNRLALNSRKVIKARYNIIDLIEEGDYVNGKYVYENGFDFSGKRCLHMQSSATYACEVFLYEEDIKDIVTKEQFESMKYEVK